MEAFSYLPFMKRLPFSSWSLANASLLAGGIILWFFIVDRSFPAIADDFAYSANILSYENFYDEHLNKYTGEILSKTKFNYQIEKRENGVIIIRNIFDVLKPSGERVFLVERLYGIDAITGKHLEGYGDKNREGYLFAPRNPGEEFTYWHINYDAPAHMHLRGEEEIEGLHVLRYECDYKADQTKDLTYLPGVPQERGVELDIHLQLWIEPTTGYLVKYEDHTTAWYYDAKTKTRIHPWNQFHNKYEETSIGKHLQNAQLAKEKGIWLHRYPPLIFLFLIAIVLAVGYKSETKKLWRPYTATGLVLVMGLSASFLLHRSLKHTESVYVETIFNRDCDSLRVSLQRELERGVNMLNAFKAKYISLKQMSREEYRREAELSMKNLDFVKVMGWIPLVPKASREGFEMKARQSGLIDYKITELNNNKPVIAGDRENYYPLYYIEPNEKNRAALGYDLASDTARRMALEKAIATGEPTATAPVILVQQLNEDSKVFLLFIPVYENEVAISDKHILNSVLSLGINPQALMMEAISHANMVSNVALTVIDPQPMNSQVLYTNAFESTTYQFSKNSTLQVANRPWQLKFQATPLFNAIQSAWLPLILVITTLLLSIFIFYLLTDNKNELQSINMQLANEITEHKLAEARLAIERGKLTVLNSELRASQQELLTQRDRLSKKKEEIGTSMQRILLLLEQSKKSEPHEGKMIIEQLEKVVKELEALLN